MDTYILVNIGSGNGLLPDLKNPKIKCQVMVEVKVQGCIVDPTSYLTRIPFLQSQSALPVLRYRQVCDIRRTLVGNKIVDHSDVVGASPVGAAPTTSSFST